MGITNAIADRIIMFVVGYVWLLALPSGLIGRRTYIDENALQPSQVCNENSGSGLFHFSPICQVRTTWDWKDVHAADRYLLDLEKLWENNSTTEE